ncbi:AMP-binding protein, partial [Micromonospora sp. DT229]|uniref:AMP-binding protein n=1 Tax=Micromonospora sp. DT229 TaxID=3393430 RepID=UPI003CEBA82F
MSGTVSDLVHLLRLRAEEGPDTTALLFEEAVDEPRALTYGGLDEQARAVAVALTAAGATTGDRVLLVHAPGLAYIAGFFGALYAGVVPVPVYPPRDSRGIARVAAIAADAGARFALTDASTGASVRQRLDPGLRWLRTDDLDLTTAGEWRAPRTDPQSVAFLQYTSGSTATPKGVVVSHANLLHNSAVIAQVIGADADTRAVSWLPPYHDMGLIGGILQPLYSGFPCLLLPPMAFLHEPARWLRAISTFRATSSAAPDFAYAECVRRISDADLAELDLSGWRHALVGAERVRPQTMDAFAARFGPAGFRASAFLPCYGLAEATLFVTGVKPDGVPARLVLDREALAADEVREVTGGVPYASCGAPAGPDQVAVVDPETSSRRPARGVGEIWVSGPTVAGGYWGRDEPFTAALDGRNWLRTGDLGFLDGDQLYVTGRLKDLIVVRGANHYPEDLEATAEHAADALLPGRAAAFPLDDGGAEAVIVVAEVRRGAALDGVAEAVRGAVSAAHGIALHDVLLVRAGAVPRTSSGKIQRRECARRYRDGELPPARPPRSPATGTAATPRPTVPAELVGVLAAALDRDPSTVDPAAALVEQGLDSLRAVRLSAALGGRVDVATLLGGASLLDLVDLPAIPAAADPVATVEGPVPATAGQERLWVLHGLGAGEAYHVTGVTRLPPGIGEAEAVAAVRWLVDRHPALRTALRIGVDGRLEQIVHGSAEPPVERLATPADLPTWSALPFDLGTAPLVRAALIAEGPSLALCAHHIVVDGRSFLVLAEEFAAACRAFAEGRRPDLPPPPHTYAAFARHAPVPPNDGFWESYLDGAEAPDMSVAPPAVGAEMFTGASVPLELPAELTEGLRALARSHQVSLFMVLAAGLTTVLARWSNRPDVLFGTAADGRPHAGFDRVVGFFATTLPLRVDTSDNPTFVDLLHRVRDQALAVYSRRDVPSPPIRHLLVLQEPRPADLPVTVPPPSGAKFDLEFDLVPQPDGALRGTLTYATARFEAADARALAAALGLVLAGVVADASRRLSRL